MKQQENIYEPRYDRGAERCAEKIENIQEKKRRKKES